MLMSTELVAADAAGHAAAAEDGHVHRPAALSQTDAAAVEQDRHVRRWLAPPIAVLPNEKMPWFSRKKSRFSGKNRLKRVRFTCCSSASTCAKSVLHGEVGGQVLRDGVLRRRGPRRRSMSLTRDGFDDVVGRQIRDRERLQLERARQVRHLESDERRVERRREVGAAQPECVRHLGEIGDLVLPLVDAPRLEAPHLRACPARSGST